MFKYTTNTLKKIEDIFKQSGYVVRYEKGNFQPGYCILESKKVVVINKYYDKEAKINCLLEILPQVDIDEEALPESLRSFYDKTLLKE